MLEVLRLIDWNNMQLLPWWMLLGGTLMVVLAVVRVFVNLVKKRWRNVFTGVVGTFVLLIFMSAWGQVYLGMTLNSGLM